MSADVVDAVVGVDTHRDTHQAEIASPSGTPIAAVQIDKRHRAVAPELVRTVRT
jgi:hypothetical protein